MQAALVKLLKQPDLLLVENPGLCTLQKGGNDGGSVYLNLCEELEQMTLPYSLLSSKQTDGFVQLVVKILADCGIIGDDATQVGK